MSDRLKALREQRGAIVTELRGITDKASTEKRDLTNEEVAKHGELFNKADALRSQIEVEERSIELARESAADEARLAEQRARESGGNLPGLPGAPAMTTEQQQRQMAAFRRYLLVGRQQLTEAEQRDLAVTPDTGGGYLTAPQEFVQTLIKRMDNLVFIRKMATIYPVMNSNGLGAPSLDGDLADMDWTTELATGQEDTAMTFGKRELKPSPMAKQIKVSKLLLRTSAMPVEQIVGDRISYKIGVTQEKAYLTGSGQNQPLGVFTLGTATNGGITSARDFSAGNSTTAIGADGLIEAKMQCKAQYWRTGQWIFHRDAVRQIAKLKDGDGQYLWRPGLSGDVPDQILNRPVNVSEYAPNTFTSGLYVGIFGDFSHYWICDLLDLQIQRLVELYAATNQDGYIARYEGDGMPVLNEAFARVKLA